MLNLISRGLAAVSLMVKQPLASFCDIETSHGDALITKQGDYLSFVRLDGMRRMATRADVERLSNAMRIDISGTLENRGHAIVGWYASDPGSGGGRNRTGQYGVVPPSREGDRDRSRRHSRRADEAVAEPDALGGGVLCSLDARRGADQGREQADEGGAGGGGAAMSDKIGDAQKFFLRSDVMAAHHAGFVSRVVSSLKGLDVAAIEISAHDGVVVAREAMYRETAGSAWRAILSGDGFDRAARRGRQAAAYEWLMWPPLRDHFFTSTRSCSMGNASRSARSNMRAST